MLPRYLSIKISEDVTMDGKETYKAVVAVDRETWAFRGDSFADVYANSIKSIEECVNTKKAAISPIEPKDGAS